jgi:hypothetical protein
MRASKAVTPAQLVGVVQKFTDQQLPLITARTARTELAEVDAGRPYTQFVDGREGAPLESVRPGGNILFKFNALIGRVLEWIYAQLLEHSPVGPDVPPHLHYIEDHELYIDGERVTAAIGALAELPIGEVAMIVNGRPYAARLEHGWSRQAPEGVYEITALAAQRLFPRAKITFQYVSLAEVAATSVRRSTRRVLHARHAQHASYRYPSIMVKAN